MQTEVVPPQAVTLPRRKVLRVVLVLVVIGVLVSPVVWYGVRRAWLRSDAEDELARLAVPGSWSPTATGDQYEGPVLGRTSYASITRAYADLPDDAASIVVAGGTAATGAGWKADAGYDPGSRVPTCRPYYDGCWAKGEYRLFLDVGTRDAAAPLGPGDTCASPPATTCTEFRFMITYEP